MKKFYTIPIKKTRIIIIAILLLCLVIALLWPLLCRFIPPNEYTGVELYESGEYLTFEKGVVFKECVEQLPFSRDTKAVFFEYYDFKYQDAILRNDPFPDVYIVQLDVGESYAAIKQYLEEYCFDKSMSYDGLGSRYYMGGPEDTDCFYVRINDQRQEVFCYLLTDRDTWAGDTIFLQFNLGWVPGEDIKP